MVLLFLTLIGHAGEPEAEDEKEHENENEHEDEDENENVLDLSSEVSLPSALDDFDTASSKVAEEGDGRLAAKLLSNRLGSRGAVRVRPQITYMQRLSPSSGALNLGASAAYQRWSVQPGFVSPAGEFRLSGSVPAVGATGWSISGHALGGSWLGRVGLLVGPSAACDRVTFSAGANVETGCALGPSANVGADLGAVRLRALATPMWVIAGERASLGGVDEMRWGGELWLRRRVVWLMAGAGLRQQADLDILTFNVGFHLQFGRAE